jgi:hypothetical protein
MAACVDAVAGRIDGPMPTFDLTYFVEVQRRGVWVPHPQTAYSRAELAGYLADLKRRYRHVRTRVQGWWCAPWDRAAQRTVSTLATYRDGRRVR